ncbi:cytochrome P450 [Kitasatospora sp. NPDC056076]|uniref:cytochrome P450 n=1 Tax=Kitasatospora sp. NPDC056076 TaxID=3345703 RepID=UPI0035D6B8AE
MTAEPGGELFAPLSPAMLADPRPVYARLRAEDPVHWHEQLGVWVLTRHEDCLRVVKDTGTFGSDLRKAGRDVPWQRLSMQTLDPPEHTELRKPVLAALRSVDLDRWTEQVRRTAEELVAGLGDEPADVITELAEPLSLSATCLLFGAPPPVQDAEFRAASRALVLSMDGGLAPERIEPGLAARVLLNDLVDGWFRAEYTDGMMAGLTAARREVPAEHLVNTARALFHAGYTSTTSLIGNALLGLDRHGALSGADLRRTDSATVNELLRLDGPVQAAGRAVHTDVDLGGRRLRRGEVVLAVFGAADHDPAVFPEPGRADFGRDPNPHLGFGRGVHACLGNHLAVRIVQALFHALGDRYEELRIVGEPVRRPSATLRGLQQLLVTGADRAPAGERQLAGERDPAGGRRPGARP